MGRALPGRLGLPALVVAAAVALSSLVAVAPAHADSAPADPTSPRTPATVTADALPAPQVDGVVYQQLIVGNTVYVAGKFAKARPAGSPAGTNEVTRTSVLAYDLTTGALSTTFAPSVVGQVKALAASPDGKRLYLGGSFTSVNGTTRYRLAAVDPRTGALVTNWAPTTNATVNSIAASGSSVYFGGIFSTVGNQARAKTGAVAASNGAILPWAPQVAGGDVLSLVTSPDGSKVVLGGSFTSVNGSDRPGYGLAMTDPATGATLPFQANDLVRNGGTTADGGAGAIFSLAATPQGLFGSGYDFKGTGNLEGAFKANWDGDLTWVEDCHGDTYSVAATSKAVYIAGHPHYCGNVGGQPQTEPWSFQHAMAFGQEATQTITRDPHGYHNWEGTPAPSILHWVPEFGIGKLTGLNQAVWSVAATEEYVVYGGEFPTVNGKTQTGLTRFAVKDLAPNSQGPVASGSTFKPDVSSLEAGTARVTFPANWDRDNADLSYEVYRNGNLKAPVYVTKASSTYWKRPTIGFVDRGVTPGSTVSYRLRATDPLGNTVLGDSVSVTVSSAPTSAYESAVTANGATSLWQLDEPSGTRGRDSIGFEDLVVQPGVVRGAAGQLAGESASTFTGDEKGTSSASSQTRIQAPDTFSVGAWFRTTTTAGGKIVGFGDKTTGRSGNYDRHVFMEPDGRVTFGVWTGQESNITSPTALNDGQWHQVVATLGADGQQFFVDGRRVGTTTTTRGQDYQGTWRVGGDTPWRGAAFFAGDVDDVAVYPTALTKAQVDAEWVASGRPSRLPVAPADAYGARVFADDPVAWFRLDGQGAQLAADSSPAGVDGVATGGVTAGGPNALAGVTGASAAFDGQTGGVATGTRTDSTDTYSLETWFRTTTTAGGKLIGFGSQQSGPSNNYDRHVYMEPDGRLQFGTWSGRMDLATSERAYNDGGWHHVVATQGRDGMRLYVDGTLVGSNGQDRSDPYSGYWRIGGDNSWAGSGWLQGDLDEAAVYAKQLSAATVKAHHALGTGTTPPAAHVAPADAYGARVFADDPIAFFRLDGEGAELGADASPQGVQGVVSGGVTGGATSALKDGTGRSAAFDGQSGVVATGERTRSLDTYSLETWFRTTTTAGGKLIGFGSQQNGWSGNYDRHVYLEPDGRLQFGTWSGQMNLATSERTYNDGSWHHVVATQGGDGMRLYVDGVVVGTNGANRSDPFSGYWRVGGDSGWSGSGYVQGEIDEAAVYATQLDEATVKAHHDLGAAATTPPVEEPAPNQAPTAAFTATTADLAVSLDASASTDPDGAVASVAWDLGDGGTATGTTVQHAYREAGTYRVTATVTDDRGATGTTTQEVTVRAPRVNAAPTAAFTTTVDGLGVAVDGSGSTDPDGAVASWAWTFGDGGTATGATATHAYAAAGTFTVTLTVTDGEGATASTTRDVTVTAPAPPAPTALIADAFARETTGGWGSADTGGAWARTGAASQYAVTGGTGQQRLSGGGASTGQSLGVTATDVDLRTSAAVSATPTGGGTYVYVTGRKVAANTEYRASVRFRTDGRAAISLNALRGSAGSATIGADTLVPGAVTAGTKVNVRLQVTGTGTTTVRVKAWVDGTPEPERWILTATDTTASLQAPGTVGLGAYASGSSTGVQVVSFDDLVVTAP